MHTMNLSELNPLYNDTRADNAYAIFTPSISHFYADLFQSAFPKGRGGVWPQVLKGSIKSLDFLDPDNAYFFYKWAMFSAGQAKGAPPPVAGPGIDVMIRDRFKGTEIIGDSGGYQIATGAWTYDIKNRPVMDKLCGEVLMWQESMADIMMSLDIPTGIIGTNTSTGTLTFADCLASTISNHTYFEANRNPILNKPILNVLQGNTINEQNIWYNAVKHFKFQGWALPFRLHGTVQRVLAQILLLHHDGMLKNTQRIHFLGLSRLHFAGALTLLMRALRKCGYEDLVISYDAATPFIVAGGPAGAFHRWEYTENGVDGGVTLRSHNLTDAFIGTKDPFPFITSPIAQNLRMDDLYVHGLPNGKTWDALSRMILAAHNVFVMISSLMEINRMMDVVSCGAFTKQPKVPFQYKDFDRCVKLMFNPKASHEEGSKILYQHKDVLQWFDRRDTITVKELRAGTKEPNWATDDLEEFAIYEDNQ